MGFTTPEIAFVTYSTPGGSKRFRQGTLIATITGTRWCAYGGIRNKKMDVTCIFNQQWFTELQFTLGLQLSVGYSVKIFQFRTEVKATVLVPPPQSNLTRSVYPNASGFFYVLILIIHLGSITFRYLFFNYSNGTHYEKAAVQWGQESKKEKAYQGNEGKTKIKSKT